MTRHTTVTCNGCGVNLGKERTSVSIEYYWPGHAKAPDKALPKPDFGVLLASSKRGERIGANEYSASFGKLDGEYCSWACVRAMLAYIETYDTREYLR